jgi:hypothetical protein
MKASAPTRSCSGVRVSGSSPPPIGLKKAKKPSESTADASPKKLLSRPTTIPRHSRKFDMLTAITAVSNHPAPLPHSIEIAKTASKGAEMASVATSHSRKYPTKLTQTPHNTVARTP